MGPVPAPGDSERASIYACLAGFILGAYVFSKMFWILRLPPVLGMLAWGIVLSHVTAYYKPGFNALMMAFSPMLTEVTFFLVLVRAGLEIDFKEVGMVHLLYGVLPVLFDAAGIAIFSSIIGISRGVLDALCLGLLLSCIGDGLVLPKLMEMKANIQIHAKMPSLMFVAAPIEASVVLTFFTLFLNLSSPSPLSTGWKIGVATLRLFSTVCVGRLVMFLLQLALRPGREPQPRCSCAKRPMFDGNAIEDMIMMVGTTFGVYTFAMLCPNGFDDSGLLQPELSAILCAAFFGNVMTKERRKEVEKLLAKVWIVFSLILFSVLGTKISFRSLGSSACSVIPLLLCGWVCRGSLVALLTLLTRHRRACNRRKTCMLCSADNGHNFFRDSAFALICGIPRATVQGALASKGIKDRAFEGMFDDAFAKEKQEQLKDFAICTLAISAPVGVLLMDLVAKRLLEGSCRTCSNIGPRSLPGSVNVSRIGSIGTLPRSVTSGYSVPVPSWRSTYQSRLDGETLSHRPVSVNSAATSEYEHKVKADFFDLLTGFPPEVFYDASDDQDAKSPSSVGSLRRELPTSYRSNGLPVVLSVEGGINTLDTCEDSSFVEEDINVGKNGPA